MPNAQHFTFELNHVIHSLRPSRSTNAGPIGSSSTSRFCIKPSVDSFHIFAKASVAGLPLDSGCFAADGAAGGLSFRPAGPSCLPLAPRGPRPRSFSIAVPVDRPRLAADGLPSSAGELRRLRAGWLANEVLVPLRSAGRRPFDPSSSPSRVLLEEILNFFFNDCFSLGTGLLALVLAFVLLRTFLLG